MLCEDIILTTWDLGFFWKITSPYFFLALMVITGCSASLLIYFNISFSVSSTRILKIRRVLKYQNCLSEGSVLYGFEPTCNWSHTQLLLIGRGLGKVTLCCLNRLRSDSFPASSDHGDGNWGTGAF